MRHDFQSRTRAILAERVAYVCSNPECRRPTIGPHSDPAQSLRIGRACHIRAAAPGGPRYDHAQSAQDRASISNGIWLCAVCSDLVDKDERVYPIEVLTAWKIATEAIALRSLRLGVPTLNIDGTSCPASPSDILAVNKHLDEAFDALAGAVFSSRLTWRYVSSAAIERAQRAIRDAEILGIPSPMIVLTRAACLFARGFPDRALEELEASSRSNELAYALMRAICLDAIGKREESLEVLETLRDKPEAPAAVFYNIGHANFRLGRPDHARVALQKAIELDPRYAEAFDLLAHMAFDRKDLPEAARLAAKAYDYMPQDEGIACNYALCLAELQDYGNATAALMPFLQQASPPVDVLQLLGRIAGELGNVSLAERFLRRALSAEPTHPVALHNMGMVLLHTGRFDEALETFEHAKDAGYPEAEDIAGRVQGLREDLERLQRDGAS